jgi:hypothetical protein
MYNNIINDDSTLVQRVSSGELVRKVMREFIMTTIDWCDWGVIERTYRLPQPGRRQK